MNQTPYHRTLSDAELASHIADTADPDSVEYRLARATLDAHTGGSDRDAEIASAYLKFVSPGPVTLTPREERVIKEIRARLVAEGSRVEALDGDDDPPRWGSYDIPAGTRGTVVSTPSLRELVVDFDGVGRMHALSQWVRKI